MPARLDLPADVAQLDTPNTFASGLVADEATVERILAPLTENWGIVRNSFRFNGELAQDNEGHTEFFPVEVVEAELLARLDRVRATLNANDAGIGEGVGRG